jgi:hypothetical protein
VAHESIAKNLRYACALRALLSPQNVARISADDRRSVGTILTLSKVQLTGRFVAMRFRRTPLLRISQLAEHVACGRSVESGSFLIHLDGKICSTKSNRSRHRDCEKGISDFVEKFVSHNYILPAAQPNFLVIAPGHIFVNDLLVSTIENVGTTTTSTTTPVISTRFKRGRVLPSTRD